MEFKYLILKDRLDDEYPVIWPGGDDKTDWRSGVSHKEMASVHRASGVRVISAGFCTLYPMITAGGLSESLKIGSRPEDSYIIKEYFGQQNDGD